MGERLRRDVGKAWKISCARYYTPMHRELCEDGQDTVIGPYVNKVCYILVLDEPFGNAIGFVPVHWAV